MNRTVFYFFFAVAGMAFAQDKAAAAPEQAQMGPAARKVKDERVVKKELQAFFQRCDELEKKSDLQASLTTIDFPIFMSTDDLKGVVEAKSYSKDEYAQMMKPFFENAPKDASTKHRRTFTILSDALANVVDDWTMTVGKTKTDGRNASLVVKVAGEWKLKGMIEAGWGGKP